MNRVDLHIHTTCSDGLLTPYEIIDSAIKQKLSIIAITDHDALVELDKIQTYANNKIRILTGIELSTDYENSEVHILGYDFDINHKLLQEKLQTLVQDRIRRVEIMVAKLQKLHYNISLERVFELASGNVAIGRPHVARALVERGYFTTVGEVFQQLLSMNGPAYVPHYKLQPQEAIQLIHEAGGVVSLAHPGLIRNEAIVAEIISFGIDALEAYHPQHDPYQMQYYCDLACQNGLFITGGSDFHALPNRFPNQLGLITIPESLIAPILERRCRA